MILSDNETKADLLNYEAAATTIVSLLRHRPDSARAQRRYASTRLQPEGVPVKSA
jgi:hypothetical protein